MKYEAREPSGREAMPQAIRRPVSINKAMASQARRYGLKEYDNSLTPPFLSTFELIVSHSRVCLSSCGPVLPSVIGNL